MEYPKLTAIGLLFLLPFLMVTSFLVLIIGAVLCFVIGFFGGIFLCYELMRDSCCCLCGLILLPISAVIVAIVGLIWGTFFYIIPTLSQYANRYILTIKNLWNHNS